MDVIQPPPDDIPENGRRRFLGTLTGFLGAVIGAILGVPLVGSFAGPLLARKEPLWVSLGPVPEQFGTPQKCTYRYVRVDGWMEKTIYGTAYVIKSGEQIRVLSNICTHLGCGVRWDQDQNAFLCPCHNGKFDIQGRPIAGPPPRPLTEYECRVVDGKLEIKMESA